MSLPWKNWFGGRKQSPVRSRVSRPRRLVLQVEELDQRILPSTLIPIPNRHEFVYDVSRGVLDATTGTPNLVQYTLSNQALTTLAIGSNTTGIAISPNNNTLYVGEAATPLNVGNIHEVHLPGNSVTNVPYPLSINELGNESFALSSNGNALFSGAYNGSGFVPLRQLNTNTNAVTIRTDDPGSGGNGTVAATGASFATITRSADGTVLLITEAGVTNGPMFIYNAVTDTFSKAFNANVTLNGVSAVNKNGTLIAYEQGNSTIIRDSSFNAVQILNGYSGGVAFDPRLDILYAVNTFTDTVDAYDTNRWTLDFQLPIGEIVPAAQWFANGMMTVSSDGNYLFLATPTGIREIFLPNVSFTQSNIFVSPSTIAAGSTTTVTLQTVDGTGSNVLSGGLTVTFSLGTGKGQGVFGAVTDNLDGTYSALLTGTIAGTNTVTATIDGQPVVVTTPPTFTVKPGPASLLKSVVSLNPTSVVAGTTTTVTLQAFDAFGNKETTGGLAVTFTLGSNAPGTAQGTFGPLTDFFNGTYTEVFTGTTAGTNTMVANIGGAPVLSSTPGITVTPGVASPSQAAVSVIPGTIQAGSTATVTLQAMDAFGNKETSGGLSVGFGLGVGTAAGTFSTVTDKGDGTYTAIFSGTLAGTSFLTASVSNHAVTSTLPSITVTPGPVSPPQATVSVAPGSVQLGGTATITLQAKDAFNNNVSSGGATVLFQLGSGVGQGSFSGVTDKGNGTYTATFTGTAAGQNTITATVNGQAITTPAPTVTVLGPPSPSQSTLSLGAGTVQVGATGTVTLQAKDANGNNETIGGLSVAFGLGNGNGKVTFNGVTDNHNGTYSATFLGTIAGQNTITATVGGQQITSTLPTLTVIGPPDPFLSTLHVSSASVPSGTTATVTLQTKDANGVLETTGGAAVSFGLGNGAGSGLFSQFNDNGDGTYTATFTGTIAGQNTLTALLNGHPLTSTLPTITVTIGSVSLSQSIVSVTSASIQSGATTTVTLIAKDPGGNNETSGGLPVSFALGNGNAQGNFSPVIDTNNGIYTTIFTGTIAGTNTIVVSINGQAFTSQPGIAVTPGPVSPSQSTISVSVGSILLGTTSTVTLTALDANGNQETGGGLPVSFGVATGSPGGSFGPVSDNGNGTYTATFTGTAAGTIVITAFINNQPVTSTPAPAIAVFGLVKGLITTDTPTFILTPNTSAARTDLWVNDVTTGQSPVLLVLNLSGTQLTLSAAQALTPGQSYIWWIRTISQSGAVSWSDGLSFTIAGLASPTPGGPGPISISDTPTFTWSAVTGANHYDLLIQDQTTGRPALHAANVTATSLALDASNALTPGHNYIWWVAAASTNGLAESFSAGQPLTIPPLQAPAQNGPSGLIASDSPTFSWNAVTGANHYDLFISDQTTGQVVNMPNVTGTSVALTTAQALSPGHGFIWYVGAVSTNGRVTAWDAGLTFAISALGTPLASAPAGTLATDMPTFTWSSVTKADHYDLLVVDQTTGQQALSAPNVTATSVALTTSQALTPGHNYVWYVGAVSTNGRVTSWNAGLTFTISALGTPLASGPSGVLATDTPTFTWSSVAGADHYDLLVVDQSTGQQALRAPNTTATSVALMKSQALTPGHSYIWYVGAVSTNGRVTSWNAGLTFTISALGTPVASGPSGALATDTPTFTWSSVTGADHYDLLVQDQSTGQQALRAPNTTVTSVALTTSQALTPGHSYVWYVGAVSTNGRVTFWSAGLTFTISALGTPQANGPSGAIATDTPTFTWTAISGAAHYDFWLNDQTTKQTQVLRLPNVAGTSLALTTAQALSPGHTYVWYVGAVSDNGQLTVWSAGQTITLAALTAPAESAPVGSIASAAPTFTWTSVTDADHYDLWVDDVTSGQKQVVRVPHVTGTSLVSPKTLTVGDTYTWYVGAVSLNGLVTVWNSGVNFTIG